MSRGAGSPRASKGAMCLSALIAFFGIMLIANGIFVYFAVATFSGGDTSNAYRKGLNYNDTLAAAELQSCARLANPARLRRHSRAAAPQRTRQGGGAGHRAACRRCAQPTGDGQGGPGGGLTEVEQGVYAADVEA